MKTELNPIVYGGKSPSAGGRIEADTLGNMIGKIHSSGPKEEYLLGWERDCENGREIKFTSQGKLMDI